MRDFRLWPLAAGGLALALSAGASARKTSVPSFGVPAAGTFSLTRPLSPSLQVEGEAHSGGSGSRLVAFGGGLLSLDENSGELVRTDAKGERHDAIELGARPTQMVVDASRGLAWVALRGEDRVVAVSVGAKMKVERSFAVVDPHGLALTPDGKRLAVASAVEGRVELWRVDTMDRVWAREVGPEPRGLAISPSGRELSVGFLTMGAVAQVELGDPKAPIRYRALDPEPDPNAAAFGLSGFPQSAAFNGGLGNPFEAGAFSEQNVVQQGRIVGSQPRSQVSNAQLDAAEPSEQGRSFARNAFALAYLGEDLLVVPHQLSTPVAASTAFVDTGSYGGGGAMSSPVRHRLTWLEGESDTLAHASVNLHQPRAMAYDAENDRLYVAGYGNDSLLAVEEATRSTAHLGFVASLNSSASGGLEACGPDGVAIVEGRPVVRCEFDRGLRFIDPETQRVATHSEGLSTRTRDAAVTRGAEIFRRGGDARISSAGTMACASCHPEGMTDGLSWRIEGRTLQTPLLAGRVVGTHPYKWDGQDSDLPTSLRNTVGRLGGGGLSKAEVADLQAFLSSLPAPRRPRAADPQSVARGQALFASAELNCDACHGGDQLSDGASHALGSDLAEADTPSLIGLARSAPYYHDGSAPSLRALLLGNGRVHGMVDQAKLSSDQIDDLVAYLETL